MRDRRLILAAVVAAAAVIRLIAIDGRLSQDEGYSWLVGSAPNGHLFLDRLAAYENTPPLFYALLAGLPLDHEWWLRLPSLVAGTASVAVLYAIVRPLAGTRAALLAALGLAVAPYAASFSNYSRGFALATLFELLSLWAAARLAQGQRARWWWLYAAAAAGALYTEYYVVLFLAALVAMLVVLGRPVGRARTAVLGTLPVLALAPWAHQISRGLDAVDETKASPVYPGPGPGSVRDTLVALTYGEHGLVANVALRYFQMFVVVGALAAGAWLLAGRVGTAGDNGRLAAALLGGTAALTLALHGIVAVAGPDVFAQRYLTVLVPLIVGLLACAVPGVPWGRSVLVAAAALAVAGVVVGIRRAHEDQGPDVPRAAAVVRAAGIRTVLTNSGVVAFYLRDSDVAVDRPFGLGVGHEALSGRPYAVVDDTRVAGGARPGPGTRQVIGSAIVVRLVR